jgi:alkylation response protein AidB-like acyl-CoA dehydrogenase
MKPRKRVMQTDHTAQHYFDLTPEQRNLREQVRAYVRERVAPQADETDRLSRLPGQAVARAAELGLLGLLVPREYGGREAGHLGW